MGNSRVCGRADVWHKDGRCLVNELQFCVYSLVYLSPCRLMICRQNLGATMVFWRRVGTAQHWTFVAALSACRKYTILTSKVMVEMNTFRT